MIVDYIDAHKADYGVEPICRALVQAGVQIAPSTYYAAKSRPPSARAVRDAEPIPEIHRVHAENYGVYGARKVHAELNRRGIQVARARSSGSCVPKASAESCGRRTRGPRHRPPKPSVLRTWSSAGFARRRRTSCGLPTFPRALCAGRYPHLRPHIRRVGVRRIRHRRVLPEGRRLATVDEPAHRSRPRRPRNGFTRRSSRWEWLVRRVVMRCRRGVRG
ncbi:IS3 family transposase [Rhodococcus koreensis]|uniref:IS3 family transposase n=1 Tax=Rhodococcus koreensis TaxID=99653 RepID=UPI00197EB8EC|nr:IS3 family transposase [Rhodococcus koreensis]